MPQRCLRCPRGARSWAPLSRTMSGDLRPRRGGVRPLHPRSSWIATRPCCSRRTATGAGTARSTPSMRRRCARSSRPAPRRPARCSTPCRPPATRCCRATSSGHASRRARRPSGAPAEPLDGFFWVYSDTGAPQLAIVAALGVRADRGGFSVLDAAAPLPADGHFAADAPPEGEFDNFLPGGELQKLFGVRTSEALMRLASLLLWQLAQRPERDG